MYISTDASFRLPNKATIAIFVGETVKREHVEAVSSVHAELLSIRLALEYLSRRNIKNATIINDCQSVVSKLCQRNLQQSGDSDFNKTLLQTKKTLKKLNTKVIWRSRENNIIPDLAASLPKNAPNELQFKTISLPKLDKLNPSIISTAIKLSEEVGELNQIIGKMQGLSGENKCSEEQLYKRIGRELLDVAQTCITFMFVLEEQYNISIESLLKVHINKLRQKGYMS